MSRSVGVVDGEHNVYLAAIEPSEAVGRFELEDRYLENPASLRRARRAMAAVLGR